MLLACRIRQARDAWRTSTHTKRQKQPPRPGALPGAGWNNYDNRGANTMDRKTIEAARTRASMTAHEMAERARAAFMMRAHADLGQFLALTLGVQLLAFVVFLIWAR